MLNPAFKKFKYIPDTELKEHRIIVPFSVDFNSIAPGPYTVPGWPQNPSVSVFSIQVSDLANVSNVSAMKSLQFSMNFNTGETTASPDCFGPMVIFVEDTQEVIFVEPSINVHPTGVQVIGAVVSASIQLFATSSSKITFMKFSDTLNGVDKGVQGQLFATLANFERDTYAFFGGGITPGSSGAGGPKPSYIGG